MPISTEFLYDGRYSKDEGVILIAPPNSSGLRELNFSNTKSIIESKNKNRYFFTRTEQGALTLENICIGIINDTYMTYKKRKSLAKWLFQTEYKPLILMDDPSLVYYALFTQGKRYDNSMLQGYLDVTIRCNSPYAYTLPIVEPKDTIYDLSNNPTAGTMIPINNLCNCEKYYYPILEFTCLDSTGTITFTNYSNAGQVFSFKGLNMNETITVDCDLGEIESSLGVSRIYNSNRNFLELVQGQNNVLVSGKCTLKTLCQFPMSV